MHSKAEWYARKNKQVMLKKPALPTPLSLIKFIVNLFLSKLQICFKKQTNKKTQGLHNTVKHSLQTKPNNNKTRKQRQVNLLSFGASLTYRESSSKSYLQKQNNPPKQKTISCSCGC